MVDNTSIRQRKGRKDIKSDEDILPEELELPKKPLTRTRNQFRIALVAVTVLAFVTRFYRLSYPQEVVFDEVHFGKFASYYLQRTYFFDVHPPFAKLLFAFVGWLVGYNGDFLFENIGDDYVAHSVPYMAYRALPASLGALTVPIIFLTMQESGYGLPACLVASSMVLFDNAHVGQMRLILLDATLVFSMACSLFAYVKFYKMRHLPFSNQWWKWLVLTGVALSCVISTKYVGVFTFFTIGSAVAIDLWNLLDYKRGLSIQEFGRHFAARAAGLLVVPFLLYLFWFQVHFAILTKSGPGDDFMTPQFQETLSENSLVLEAKTVYYGDTVTLRHKETKALLHSHVAPYPLRYEDGRVSSQGQQVTGYPHDDVNNHWVIKPAEQFSDSEAHVVKNGDLIKLQHVVTSTDLLSHDVASPYYPTNQEFTTVSQQESYGARHNDTLFELRVEGAAGQDFKTKSSHFKLIHYPSKIAMWTHVKPLPDWAFGQQEVNGNRNVAQTSNIWFADDIIGLQDESRLAPVEARKPKSMSFSKKYLELQAAMFRHNNALTSDHPYATVPIMWPFLLRGVSFWTKNDTREQIYFLGNPIGWWLSSALIAVLSGIMLGDQLTMRRGNQLLDDPLRTRMYNSAGFFILAWAAHYFPFFLMGRQLFLHHYLPAHLCSALVAGAFVQLIFENAPVTDPVSEGVVVTPKTFKARISRQPLFNQLKGSKSAWIAASVIIGLSAYTFVFFAPLTYGTPGMDVPAVMARKWLDTWDFHFAK